jgi:hypothetical protein
LQVVFEEYGAKPEHHEDQALRVHSWHFFAAAHFVIALLGLGLARAGHQVFSPHPVGSEKFLLKKFVALGVQFQPHLEY